MKKQNSNYNWDLTKMIKDEKEFQEKKELVLNLSDKILNLKGKILENEKTLYEYLNLNDKLNIEFENIYIYANMLCDTNTNNNEYQILKQQAQKLLEIITEKLSFTTPELLEKDFNYIKTLINKNQKLKPYEFYLENIYRYKKYTKSILEEQTIATLENAFGTPSNAYYNLNNADINLGIIKDEDKKEVKLNASNYIKYMESTNEEVRKNAFENMYNYYKNLKNTITSLYIGEVKESVCISKLRGYDSSLQASLFNDKLNIDVYKNLIKKVNNNLKHTHKYYKIKKDYLKLEKLHMYDIYLNIKKENIEEIIYEDAKDIIKKSLSYLGDEYLQILDKAFNENWIDVFPKDFKKSGAYSWGSYTSNPYILLNYNNSIDSLSTLAHELGHSIHSYYSKENQTYVNHSYPIILAEIASTVNELLLNNYLFETANEEEKVEYLIEYIEKVRTTIYRQTMFAEFEMIIHEKEEKNVSLTEEYISNIYYELNKKYHGSDVISDELIRYEWMRIPHFYTPFYVYKYAIGLSIAIKISQDIINNENDMRTKYINFLKQGCSKYPTDQLKELGINLEDGSIVDEALNIFKEKVEKLKEILKSR